MGRKVHSHDLQRIGTPTDLVFDQGAGTRSHEWRRCSEDELLRHTPTDPVQLWEKGLDRSAGCARAVVAVLRGRPGFVDQSSIWASLEECLNNALSTDRSEMGNRLQEPALLWAIGRLQELGGHPEVAETQYREAFEIQVQEWGWAHDETLRLADKFATFLEEQSKGDLASQIRKRQKIEELAVHEDRTNLETLREVAYQCVVERNFTEAEDIYRRLLDKRFELSNTQCHLARVLFITSREIEAEKELDDAWETRDTCKDKPYLPVRIRYLKACVAMVRGQDPGESLKDLKVSLREPGVCHVWNTDTILEHLKPKVSEELFNLMTLVATVISSDDKLSKLPENGLWQKI